MTNTIKDIIFAQSMIFAEGYINNELTNHLMNKTSKESLTKDTASKFESAMITAIKTHDAFSHIATSIDDLDKDKL